MDQNRAFAARFFNEVWGLLGSARTAEADLRMIHLAHASRAHWQDAGGAREWAIGEWQVARVYAELGRGEAAVYHAQAALNLTAGGAVGAFLQGCAHEGMARALTASGRNDEAARHHAAALTIAGQLDDAEERELLLLDLNGGR